MPELLDAYAFWTHKGGVGKTTTAFHLSTMYAQMFDGTTKGRDGSLLPRREVLVFDCDPQANLSASLLTHTHENKASAGKKRKTGAEQPVAWVRDPGALQVDRLAVRCVGEQKLPANVSGALYARDQGAGSEPDWTVFLTKVSDINPNMPDNLWLLAGDTDLDSNDAHLSTKLNQSSAGIANPFVTTLSLLQNYRDACAAKMPHDTVVFIDCNPGFSTYTKIALAAAKSLIVPANMDDYSTEALKMMLRKLYNRLPVSEDHPFHNQLVKNSHASRAYQERHTGLELPPIRLIIHNRDPVAAVRGLNAPSAFRSQNNKVVHKEVVKYHREKKHAGFPIIVQPMVGGGLRGFVKDSLTGFNVNAKKMDKPAATTMTTRDDPAGLTEFATFYTCPLKDLTTSTVAATYLGIPMTALKRKQNAVKTLLARAQLNDVTREAGQDAVAEVLMYLEDNLPNGKDLTQ